jgi:opacity protein-like surface antigen
MKKVMMMVVAAMMATMSANAQYKAETWSIQPMIGLGLSAITNMDYHPLTGKKVDNTLTGAVMLGVEAEYMLTKQFSVAGGLNYTMQGCGWDNVKSGSTEYKKLRMDLGYIKIPIVANCYLGSGFAVKAGVQFGFMTDAHLKMTTESTLSGYDVTTNISADFKKDLEKFEFAIPLGISYEFKDHWVLDARYQLSLSKLNKESANKDNKNSLFMLTCGYKFKL